MMLAASLLKRLRRSPCPAAARAGFSLVEALLALLVVGVVSSVAGTIMISQVKMSASIELAQRQRDDTNRLDYLIQIEAGEASSVEKSPALPGACGGPATAIAAFVVPRDQGSYLTASNVSRVYYFNSGGNIWRCGPPVHRSGRLDHALDQDGNAVLEAGIAVRYATLELTTCSSEQTGAQQLVYKIVFADPKYKPDCSIARAKTLFICNKGEGAC